MVREASEQAMALNSKRTQTFFNEFLITTTQFLNQFITECEDKFFEFERKLNRIESNLVIIEAKLASVPEENPPAEDTQAVPQQPPIPPPEAPQPTQTSQSAPETSSQNQQQQQQQISDPVPEEKAAQEASNLIKITESFLYKKFFKMVKFGVPPTAVKGKMVSEGLDGSLLDKPDLMVEKVPEDDEAEEAE